MEDELAGKWFEVLPARILAVLTERLGDEFELYDQKGDVFCQYSGEKVYRFVRKSDRRVFKLADFVPVDSGCRYHFLQPL